MTNTARSAQPVPADLGAALRERVVVADGAMGTMLQASDATLSDFDGHEGCNEILNVTRPDIVGAVHEGYLEAGVDCVTTNTFGANQGNLGEYGLADRIAELSEAGARIARQAADHWGTPERPRWVLGSVGPGTKLPTLGHAQFADLRDAYRSNAAGLLRGGVDAIIIETSQDLLQAKAAIIGARRAMAAAGARIPLIAQVTIETTGAMLLGSEIGTALTANHAHASMMGVYGMLSVGLALFCLRYIIPERLWSDRAARVSFWSLNLGLAWMVFARFPSMICMW